MQSIVMKRRLVGNGQGKDLCQLTEHGESYYRLGFCGNYEMTKRKEGNTLYPSSC